MLNRTVNAVIKDWINHGSEALLVTGARQIGKTYTIRECLKESGHPFIELNFIEQPELIELFQSAKNTSDLVLRISAVTSNKLIPGETIIFMDEVQEYHNIVTRIKFLVENSSFHYILSGSLLGVELNDLRSAPVGYLRIIDMYPLSLKEFFIAIGLQENILDHINTCFLEKEPVDEVVHDRMIDAFYLYLIIGGMPEAVQTYIDTNDIAQVDEVHTKIHRLYEMEFSRFDKKTKLMPKDLYDTIPSELESKNKRFVLSKIDGKIEFNRTENSFLWLKDSGTALPVYNVTEPLSPLLLSEKRSLFKLFMADVGMLTSCYSKQTQFSILKKDKGINNGGLFENAVVQELVSKGFSVYYYNSKKFGELDALIEIDGKVIPIEVKSGKDYHRHNALKTITDNPEYHIEQAYVLCNENLSVKDKITYLPIYMMFCIDDIHIHNTIYPFSLKDL